MDRSPKIILIPFLTLILAILAGSAYRTYQVSQIGEHCDEIMIEDELIDVRIIAEKVGYDPEFKNQDELHITNPRAFWYPGFCLVKFDGNKLVRFRMMQTGEK